MDKNRPHCMGLTPEKVLGNREKFGENVLTPPEKEPWWKALVEKFKDPIIVVLLVALAASFGVSCYHYWGEGEPMTVFFEPLGIFFAILLATTVGFFFEWSANRKFEMLNQVSDDDAVKVIRQGSVREIPKREVVCEDLVVINTGDEIPADGRLVEAVSLQVNESTLTGEPVIKKSIVKAEFDAEATYPTNCLYRGTTVVDGHGIFEVTAVGDSTEYGKVYEGAQIETQIETPLQLQLKRLAGLISNVSYAIAALIVVARLLIYFTAQTGAIDWIAAGGYILNTMMIAVTVIVVAVPEGLPMSVTLSLALSMRRMLSTNNLVRQMHACETMGATTVICTDKTGTLTQNRMQVAETAFPSFSGQTLGGNTVASLVAEGMAVNSTAFLDDSDPEKVKAIGNPTEAALLLWLNAQGVDYRVLRERMPAVDQLTFSTERKYMATVVDSVALGKRVLFVKGAPEIIFEHADRVALSEDKMLPAADYREQLAEELSRYQNQAMRTLGFAYRVMQPNEQPFENGRIHFSDLTFMGIAAISDPVREDVPQAVRSCMDAGIRVKIVTGDTPGTAKEIGRQIGLWTPEDTDLNHITGVEFAALSDDELFDRVMDLKVISRARPMDKKRLVETLQRHHQVVAVTGDGTNDAPALNAAQVGLSMGDGTQVAKEASAITIMDNSFQSITRAVVWGRSLYRNIQRFIVFQMTINVAACLIVLIGAFLGTESPLTVTQMLWVNLIMDTFAALALASLPPTDDVMREKPRDNQAHIISRPMAKRIIGVGVGFVVLLFGLIQYFKQVELSSLADFRVGDFFAAFFDFSHSHVELSLYERTLLFTIFVMLQFWNMFNAKAFLSGGSAFKGLRKSLKGFGLVALAIVGGQILIVTFGGRMFTVQPIATEDWIWITVVTSLVLWIGELVRLICAKK